MAQERQPSVLIVEDDLVLADMLSAYFSAQGYHTLSTGWGVQALRLAAEALPDLILLDINLPDTTGYDVCRSLWESHKTRHIPVIFLTERDQRLDRVRGLEMGVADYITKPFDVEELWLRVRNTLRRATLARTENAITGLPDGEMVTDVLARLLGSSHTGWGLLVAALLGLDAFREQYGFVAGDEVLHVVSRTLVNAVSMAGGEAGFCGHLDTDVFVMLVPATFLDDLQGRIAERLAGSLQYFYPSSVRADQGNTTDWLALGVGRVTAADGPFAGVDDLQRRLRAAAGQARIE